MSQEGGENYTSNITPEGEREISEKEWEIFNKLKLRDVVSAYVTIKDERVLCEDCRVAHLSKDGTGNLRIEKRITGDNSLYQAGTFYPISIRDVVDTPYNVKG